MKLKMLAARAVLFVSAISIVSIGCSDDPTEVDAASADSGSDLALDASLDAGADSAADSANDATAIPKTSVGDQLKWLLGEINSGKLDEAGYKAHFSAAYQAQRSFNSFVSRYLELMQGVPISYVACDPGGTSLEITAHLYGTKTKTWSKMRIGVSASPPNSIAGISWNGEPTLDPAYGAIGKDELGLQPYDPNKSTSSPTFKVELLDRTTGKPFIPSISGTTDSKYHYVRLKPPSGHSEVGVRIEHSDGQVTDNYATYFKGGEEIRGRVAGFNKGAFSYYAGLVSLSVDAGKAQLWGITLYGPVLGQSMFPYNYVGCAKASFTPAASGVYYGRPPKYLPSLTATDTYLTWPTFFVFNLPPVSHTVSLNAGSDKLDTSLPPLIADHVTTVWLVYDSTTYKTNPTPLGCTP